MATMTKVRTSPREYKGSDGEFLAACERAKVAPTNRQFRRWTQKRGQAYAARQ